MAGSVVGRGPFVSAVFAMKRAKAPRIPRACGEFSSDMIVLHSRAAQHPGTSAGIPAVSCEFPQIGGGFPQIGGEVPQIRREFPQIRPEFQQIRPEFQQTRREFPQIAGGFVPQIRREFLAADPPWIFSDLERKFQQNRRKTPRACPHCSSKRATYRRPGVL